MDTETSSKITRRAVLQSVSLAAASGAVAACAPAATPAAAPPAQAPAATKPKEAWEQQWDDTVAAAKKEGGLNFVGFPGTGYREGVAAFEKAFPGLTVEYSSMNASQFGPKVAQERNGGVYNYDLITSNYGTFGLTIIPSGAIEPIRPMLFRADVLDNNVWNGGFELGLIEGKWGYAGFSEMWPAVWINTDQVKEGEIRTFDDLLNPKWKGKILAGDPRSFGGGFWPGTTLRMKRG
ncbi:MAG: extracellular solute-binding protein, partial [Chloroflexota bacterium]